MTKARKIAYWIATAWLALGMFSTGLVQLLQVEENVEMVLQLGYPRNFLTLLGIWKILGAIVVLMPRFPIVKEWAYAGFFFAMSGAIISHIAIGKPADIFPALLLLILTIISWYLRPGSRKLLSHNPEEN